MLSQSQLHYNLMKRLSKLGILTLEWDGGNIWTKAALHIL